MRRPMMVWLVAAAFAVTVPWHLDAQERRGRARPAEVMTDAIERDSSGNVIFRREVYAYPRDSRRDPFSSLIQSGDVRPMIADLQVIAITVAGSERQSIATVKDRSTNEIYRVRVGSVFGRLRVIAIRQREIAVEIDEFGFKRQENLSINVPVGGGRTP